MWNSDIFLEKLAVFRAGPSSSYEDTISFRTSIPGDGYDIYPLDADFPAFATNHNNVWKPVEEGNEFLNYTAFRKHDSMDNEIFERLTSTCCLERNCTMLTTITTYDQYSNYGWIMYKYNYNILLLYNNFPETITLFKRGSERKYNFTKATFTPNNNKLDIIAEYTYVLSGNKRRRLEDAEVEEKAREEKQKSKNLSKLVEYFRKLDKEELKEEM